MAYTKRIKSHCRSQRETKQRLLRDKNFQEIFGESQKNRLKPPFVYGSINQTTTRREKRFYSEQYAYAKADPRGLKNQSQKEKAETAHKHTQKFFIKRQSCRTLKKTL